ncbi:MAG: helix-turn-helix transcriptional regulator, partial [Chloroflexota bacterium]
MQTKLYIPSLRPNLVRRPQLVRQLEQGQQSGHKLTLISAPAGFGKTTLVAEWLERKAGNGGMEDEGDLAWLSLDEGDNDLVRFLMYVVTALNQAGGEEPAVGKGALEMLRSSRSAPPIDILVSLINDVAGMPERIVLVLDDYHIIDSQPIDEALTFLLEHMPPNMHLIIATREDPNLPLARLRALGQLTELRASALRFSSSEAADFLNSAMGMDLSPAEVDALESRTEGWIAGLQLAALALQGQRVARKGEDPAAFITDFSGGHRFVLDYLLEEVIEQQTPEIERFLLQTAVLDRLNGSLCDALTGQENGRQTLQWLERTNLFITGLDQERNWYRYHHLFADLLRKRLVQRHPDWAATLNQQASDWCKQNDLASEAIEYALRAEDYGRAAQVLEGQLEARWGKGTHGQLRRWLDALPEEELSIRPMLAIFQARYQCNRGQLDEAERTLAAVDRALGLRTDEASQGQPEEQSPPIDSELAKLQARALATRALLGSYQGDVPSIIRYASRALALHPQDDLTWRSVTALTLGNAHGFKGDMTAAYEARFKGLQSCQEAGDSYFILIAFLEVAITLREQGRLRETIDICRQQFQFAAESGLGQTTAVGWLLGIWGETLAEMGDLDGAIERVEEGFALTRHGTDLQMLGWSVMCLIRTLYTRGEFAKADGLFRQMENRGGESQMPPWITSQMAIWRARIWLAQGNVDAASLWAEARWLDSEEVKPFQEIG